MAETVLTKHCICCKRNLPVGCFTPSKRGGSGFKTYCRPCCAEKERLRRVGQVRIKIRQRVRDDRLKNPEIYLERERRANQKRKSSPDYRLVSNADVTRRLKEKYQESNPQRSCVICGILFCNLFGKQSFKPTCSDPCSSELGRRRAWRKNANRRALVRGASVELVDVFAVLERDGWRCQICGIKTPKSKRGTYEHNAPELDHIMPLSVGGEHSYANVQCACRRCNLSKRNRPLGQMRLFG